MQIRLGNRQDEPAVQALVFDVMREFALTPNIDGAESDLKNLEANYPGKNGIFLVAEQEGEIVGIAGAREGVDSSQLELVRLATSRLWRRRGIARELIKVILKFGQDMGYTRIQVEPARQYPGDVPVMLALGFTSADVEDAQRVWYLDLTATRAFSPS